MKVFNTEQIRSWDQYTILEEPIASIDLMERAADAFVQWFVSRFPDTERPICIYAGTGNNGGDGIAVARMLHQRFYTVKVFVCAFSGKQSADFEQQIAMLPPHNAVDVEWLGVDDPIAPVQEQTVIIDALFGSGLSRALEGPWADIIQRLNSFPNEKVAIDLPSGLFADKPSSGPVLSVAHTFSFEIPKLAFFAAENADWVGEWDFGPIGLHPDYSDQTETPYRYLDQNWVQQAWKPRPKFSHKGTFGHALLINGSKGKMGAAALAASACLRTGVGLLSLHTPAIGYSILQTLVPEAMCSIDPSEDCWSDLPDIAPYTAIGLGCGIGQSTETVEVLKQLLETATKPLVLDADALNILAQHPDWFSLLPAGSILSPHPKEFSRLFGETNNHFERIEKQREMAAMHQVHLILKGAHTSIASPDGTCWFNSTGNPGMATGGSGDVLTGILTGLLAQGYSPEESCLLGVFIHGLAGDLASVHLGQTGLVASDIIDGLAEVWLELEAGLE